MKFLCIGLCENEERRVVHQDLFSPLYVWAEMREHSAVCLLKSWDGLGIDLEEKRER